MDLKLTGKRALVCGGSQGIGLGISKALAQEGVTVTMLSRNEEKLKNAIHQLLGTGHQFIVADLGASREIDQLQEKISTGKFDILINNTGGPSPGLLNDTNWETLENAFTMHVKSMHLFTQWCLPHMKNQRFGRILNIISTSVRIPIPNLGVSNTIRGAAASWLKTTSNEVGKYCITANSILPGLIDTPRLEGLVNSMVSEQHDRQAVVSGLLQTIPVGRFGSPEELGDLVAFLCSGLAAYINGVSIPFDGGRTGTI